MGSDELGRGYGEKDGSIAFSWTWGTHLRRFAVMGKTKVAGTGVSRAVATEGKSSPVANSGGFSAWVASAQARRGHEKPSASWLEEAQARPTLVTAMTRRWELDDGELWQWSGLSVSTKRFKRGR